MKTFQLKITLFNLMINLNLAWYDFLFQFHDSIHENIYSHEMFLND